MDISKKTILKITFFVILAGLAGIGFRFSGVLRKSAPPVEPVETAPDDSLKNGADGQGGGALAPAISPVQERDKQPETGDLPKQPVREEEQPVADPVESERFVVSPEDTAVERVADRLFDLEFIKDKPDFIDAFGAKAGESVGAGGYKLSKNEDVDSIVKTLRAKPYMKWVIIPEGLRKEEIAELLAGSLGWTAAQKTQWIATDTAAKAEYLEGVYFPDTYLIPGDETPAKVADRLIAKFNEKFSSYLPEFNAQNIKWTTGLTLASIVQREAADKADMPLIAGILWNRLEQGMALNADATLQYARGDIGGGWWRE